MNTTTKRPVYRWRVHHSDYPSVIVTGATRYDAMIAAAKLWGAPWTPIARACTFERLEEVAGRGR